MDGGEEPGPVGEDRYVYDGGGGLLAPVKDMRGAEDVDQKREQEAGADDRGKGAGEEAKLLGSEEGVRQEQRGRGGGAAEDEEAGDAAQRVGAGGLGAFEEPEAGQRVTVIGVYADGDEREVTEDRDG